MKIQNKRFVYLISPTKILDNTFFKSLELVFKSKKVSFFQLRLKNEKLSKKILKNKIIGITCHNSISLAKKALVNGANYIAVGAFYKTKTKKVKFRAKPSILRKIKKLSNNPVVAIGGINEKNYRKLLLNKANFLAISGYIWNNNKYKPNEAIERLK